MDRRNGRRPRGPGHRVKKLSADNLTNLSPHPLLVALEFTHPPLLQRVTAIENAMARKGGA